MKKISFQTGFTGFTRFLGSGAAPQFLILLILLILSKNTVAAPLQWTCNWPDARPQTFSLYQGETATFEPTFRVNGRTVTNATIEAVWYQTNGMDQAWWKLDGNTFAPSNDVGAAAYRFFVEASVPQSNNPNNSNNQTISYRANGTLRMLPSPGFTPNAIEPPVVALDFATIEIANAPWLEEETDPTVPAWAKEANPPLPPDYSNVSNKAMTALQSYSESDPTVPAWAKASSKPSYTASEVGAATASSVSTLSSQVTSIGAHLNAEDARFVSTNYNSDVHMPEASAEVNISNEWLVIWREMTRWDAFTGPGFDWSAWCGFNCFRTNLLAELDQKADRAWGFYDSHTGLYAPEGYTQISSSNVLIAAGMGYQRTITAEGTYWVLTANEPYATYGISSNGFFRVEDADGNVQFEIVKGDKRTVPAPAGGVTVGSGSPHPLTISYPVESQPTLEVALSLSYPSSWHAEADASCPAVVTWTGSSGAYVATVTPAAPAAQLFVRATYQVGGSTYINNRAPVSLSGGIIYNGTVYMPTVSGNELKFIAQ